MKEVLKTVLEFLERPAWRHEYALANINQAITAIKEALAQQSNEQVEPVTFLDWYKNATWGNEDFQEGCNRAWNAAIKYTHPPVPIATLTQQELLTAQPKDQKTYPDSPMGYA